MSTASGRMGLAVAAICVMLPACGQKGPPLAPLHLVPSAAVELSVRRVGDQARLRFVLPTTNANGPGPVELDRVEIYAVTAAPGFIPPNRELLTKPYLVGQVEVRPPLEEGEQPKEGDTRPSPGEAVFFDDPLTAEKLKPLSPKEPAPAPPTPPPAVVPAAPAAPAAPVSKDPMRIYAVRGVARSGRTGPPSTRVQVPIVPLPAPPEDVSAKVTETAVTLGWKPPAEVPSAPATLGFNVYRAGEPMTPLNPSPLASPSFEFSGAQFGQQRCFRVRSVIVSKDGAVEGDLSEEECVTPVDVFPPAAPATPSAVATAGEISLIWDPNKETDLAGYVVLRADAPDGVLQPITPAPIRETSYRDTTVKPGTRYIYAIVAVDGATPPNASPQSPRVEETAR